MNPVARRDAEEDARGPRALDLFQGFQEGEEIAHLVRIEAELRHGRMSGNDAFR